MSGVTREERDWENKGAYGHTVLISQPRCGSTLIMRLMALAGGTPVVGDRDVEFYDLITKLWNHKDPHAKYGAIREMEEKNIFPDTLLCWKEECYLNGHAYKLKQLLFNPEALSGRTKFIKTTMMGFQNDLLIPFVQMLREVHDQGTPTPLRIVFLTRNHDDIIKSIADAGVMGSTTAKHSPEIVKKVLENQLSQFKEAYKLGDIWLKYEDFILDPQKYLLKLKPADYPMPYRIERVMEKKLK